MLNNNTIYKAHYSSGLKALYNKNKNTRLYKKTNTLKTIDKITNTL